MDQLKRLVIDWMRQSIKKMNDKRQQQMFEPVINAAKLGNDYVFGRPALLVVHAKRKNITAPADSSIALAHCEFLAGAMGLGSCWAGYFQLAANSHPPLRQALNLPEEDNVLGGIILGYPAVSYQRTPPRPPAKVRWHTL